MNAFIGTWIVWSLSCIHHDPCSYYTAMRVIKFEFVCFSSTSSFGDAYCLLYAGRLQKTDLDRFGPGKCSAAVTVAPPFSRNENESREKNRVKRTEDVKRQTGRKIKPVRRILFPVEPTNANDLYAIH